jgi:hypothetical protein
VLVGALRTKDQFFKALEYKFYHIPYSKVKSKGLSFKYVAISQRIEHFGVDAGIRYYGKVDSQELVKRNEITEIPSDSEELYVKFCIKDWELLEKPIKPKGFGIRSHMYTNKQLLMSAEYLPELCVKNKIEFRIYIELKRIFDTISFNTVSKNLDGINENWFECNGAKIMVDGGIIKVIKNGAFRIFDSKDFSSKPRTLIKIIERIIDDKSKH